VLLLAAGTSHALAAGAAHPRIRGLVGWMARGWSLVAAGALIALPYLGSRIPDQPPDTPLRFALAAILTLTVCGLILSRSPEAWCGTAGIVALAALAYGTFWILGGPALEWTRGRDGAERFGRLAAAGTPAGHEILAWDAFPDPFVYYAERPVREMTEVDQVLDELQGSPSGLVLLAKTRALDELPAAVEVEVLHRQTSYRERDLSLVRLSLKAAPRPGRTHRWARRDP
jgi:hypothetical protein